MTSSPQGQTPAEDELLDPAALSLLRRLQNQNGGIHSNVAEEFDANDEDGLQGGQLWDNPTTSPTLRPSQSPTLRPTDEPTSHPTLSGREWTIRGTVWYDRNANGIRDSNVKVDGMGDDVEYTHGLAGVSLQLVQCDPDTGRAYTPKAGETLESFAVTPTAGVGVHGEAQIVPTHSGNGKFEFHLALGHGLQRHYFIQVMSLPPQFGFTAGVCNDAGPGWECAYLDQPSNSATPINAWRSPECVFVDRQGKVSKLIELGVMRVGDTQAVGTKVALFMAFDGSGDRRRLAGIIRRARVIDEEDDGLRITTRYLLDHQDKVAIGTVTAEVLAAALDARLAQSGVKLESVNADDVIFSQTSDKSGGGDTSELAVNMEVKGHYSPPPFLDFDYIVQDSINKDTTKIRRGLQDFNKNCRDQTNKVKTEGYKEEDFNSVVSTSGAKTNQQDTSVIDNAYSTACSSDLFVPQYFETSLKEIGARDVTDPFKEFESVVYYAPEEEGILEQWAIAPVVGLAGLIVLLTGMFLFRRAIGRRVDKFSSSNKTKDIAGDEMRCFGEAGGAVDDGSVDSAFYTDSDSDMEETEKERKMRIKRKNKADEQKFDRKNSLQRKRGVSKRELASSTSKPSRRSRRNLTGSGAMRTSLKEQRRLLAASQVSQGSDNTEAISLREEDAKMKKGYRGDDTKPVLKKISSSRGKKHSSSDCNGRRGRTRQKGGDNAKSYVSSSLV